MLTIIFLIGQEAEISCIMCVAATPPADQEVDSSKKDDDITMQPGEALTQQSATFSDESQGIIFYVIHHLYLGFLFQSHFSSQTLQ